jgi:hypothetical protein
MAIVERAEVFERAVHRYLRGVNHDPLSPAVQEAARAVSVLRERLSPSAPPGTPAYSSRQLPRGQRLQLNLKEPEGGGSVVTCRVGEQREEFLVLTGLSPPDGVAGVRALEAMFFVGKGAHSFDATVLDSDTAAGTCGVTHSIDIRPGGRREYQRVDVNRPVVFRAAWEDSDVQREGTALDLSAGGIGLLSPCYYETGEELIVELRPQALVGDRTGAGEGRMADRTIKARIADSRHTPDGRCRYHVEFSDVDQDDRQYLFRLIRRIEARAGGRASGE